MQISQQSMKNPLRVNFSQMLNLLFICQSATISPHTHALLEMGGKLLCSKRSPTVRTCTVNILFQRLRVIAKYVEALLVHYGLLLIDTAHGMCDHN